MNSLTSQTRIDPTPTAEIVRKTEEVIKAYKEAGHALRYVSQVVAELQKILPDDMCVRLPDGLLNGFPPSEISLPDEIRKKDLIRKTRKVDPAANGTSKYGEFLMDIDPPISSRSPLKLRPIAPIIIEKHLQEKRKSMIRGDTISPPYEKLRFKEFIKEEEIMEDELMPHSQSSLENSGRSSKSGKKSRKSKVRHEPYEKPTSPSNNEDSLDIPKQFYAMKMNKPPLKCLNNRLHLTKHRKSKSKKSKPSEEQQTSIADSHDQSSTPKSNETSSFSSSGEGEVSPGSPNSSTKVSNVAAVNSLTPEQDQLVDDFLKCLEPRLANGTVSQKGIALEIREVSGNKSQIVQGTISKLIRRIAVPKDTATLAAIRTWIDAEQSKNESSHSSSSSSASSS
ncbi:hypothetical protein G9A89_020872 [Geosiphon pyriformis]|nr:hypothetical protein G9A89_020872 [Geosiphon pyriformis]